jgi:hypothetical protein
VREEGRGWQGRVGQQQGEEDRGSTHTHTHSSNSSGSSSNNSSGTGHNRMMEELAAPVLTRAALALTDKGH